MASSRSPASATTSGASLAFCHAHSADYNHLSAREGRGNRGHESTMPLLWLRVALGFYGVGLLYALVALTRSSDLLSRIAIPATSLGMVFHFVSLSEAVLLSP